MQLPGEAGPLLVEALLSHDALLACGQLAHPPAALGWKGRVEVRESEPAPCSGVTANLEEAIVESGRRARSASFAASLSRGEAA